jgi:hypothetical protein
MFAEVKRMPLPRSSIRTYWLVGLLAAGCTGYVVGPAGSDVGPGGGGAGPAPVPAPKADDPITGPIASNPGESSRLTRLSHKQWAASVGDLLRLGTPSPLADSFISESVRTSFDNNGSSLDVSPELWTDYEKAAEAVANQVARDATRLAAVMPPGAPGDAAGKARAFIQSFGSRAYRRPLSDAEIARYATLFNQGPALIGSGDAFADGVELVVTLFLQSPSFLYRTELSTAVVNGKVPLSDYEIASRLSYALVGSMPDDMLFAAAAARKLHTRADVLTHAQRLLATAGGQATLRDFHEQLFHTGAYSDIKRANQPAFKAGMGDDMREEAFAFIKDVVVDREKGLTELLTAPYSFVNSKLAPLYGLSVPAPRAGQPDPLRRVDLDPAERAGLFTQVGFLGSNDNATDTTPRPIMRGKHMNLDVLCAALPAPPNVPPLPAQSPGTTNRKLIEAFTQQAGSICQGCHGVLINPLGFAFEHYDSMGRWRDADNGNPVDATGTYGFAEGSRSFNGAVEMMSIIAAGKQSHECYSKRLLEYLYGREVVEGAAADAALVTEVGRRSHGNVSVKSMILDLVSTDAFLNRLP